ncbi:MAG: hypothetical protein CVU63_20640 [Deltaproteobacteria bacterium HGW-Deltaproteobacteria-20]|jgi:hypothetical protein|nr:MAG: hypothetical protein CVU63_20640 [Deltaproteobacteria bacterium HGW-Deltaproteobacteria-20]
MILPVDERLRQEAERYRLRFTCESCAWFDAEGGTCSHAYPNEAHKGIDLNVADRVAFCKEFELA